MEKDILKKYINGEATFQERSQIFEWISAHREHYEEYILNKRIHDTTIYQRDTMLEKLQNFKKTPTIIVKVVEYAAAACIIVALNCMFNSWYKGRTDDTLKSVSVPIGQYTSMTLKDGTVIDLGSNSKLTFPSAFKGNERKVYLEGSAYFNVTRNKRKPFIVASQEGMVKVTGTTFYVDAFPTRHVFKTSLIEGQVSVFHPDNARDKLHLNPGLQAFLVDGQFVITPIDDYDQFLWREGYIAFKGKTLEEIFILLQNSYNITIIVKDKSKFASPTYSGKFYLLDGVDYALQILQRKAGFKYERDEHEQIIYIT